MKGQCCAPEMAPRQANGTVWPPPPNQINPLEVQLNSVLEKLDKLAAGQEALRTSVAKVTKDVETLMTEGVPSVKKAGVPKMNQNGMDMTTDTELKVDQIQPLQHNESMIAEEEKVYKDTMMLKELFILTESYEKEEADMANKRKTFAGSMEVAKGMNLSNIEMSMDSGMAVLIILNSMFLWIDADFNPTGDNAICNIVNYIFSICFILELLTKWKLFGPVLLYCQSESAKSNSFDLILVFLDVLQNILSFANVKGLFPASVLRLMRLARIGRILRLFNLSIFENLLAMISGLIGGMPTLGWSIVLFAIVIYIPALVFRQTLGMHHEEPEIAYYFDNVPRSMFTVFRCSFGDCSTNGGIPLFELVHVRSGFMYTYIYCLMVFIVTVGLFNVISAIFVESTMAAALASTNYARGQRLKDHNLWARCITQIVRVSWLHVKGTVPEKISDYAADAVAIDLDSALFMELVQEKDFVAALDGLDINPDDHRYLADILDPDNGGSIGMVDLVDGLARLRGDPRRSDIVAVDLMVRSLQVEIGKIIDYTKPLDSSRASTKQ